MHLLAGDWQTCCITGAVMTDKMVQWRLWMVSTTICRAGVSIGVSCEIFLLFNNSIVLMPIYVYLLYFVYRWNFLLRKIFDHFHCVYWVLWWLNLKQSIELFQKLNYHAWLSSSGEVTHSNFSTEIPLNVYLFSTQIFYIWAEQDGPILCILGSLSLD